MSKVLISLVVVLVLGMSFLVWGYFDSQARINQLSDRLEQEMQKVSDDFLQEDDFYPCIDKIWNYLELDEDFHEKIQEIEN
jgi:hypothetical protein